VQVAAAMPRDHSECTSGGDDADENEGCEQDDVTRVVMGGDVMSR